LVGPRARSRRVERGRGRGASASYDAARAESLAVNYVAPTIEDMQRELDFVKGWLGRIKKYRE